MTTTRSSPIGYWSEGSTVGRYFGISLDGWIVGKIRYTCNRLIVDQWIFGSVTLKSLGGIFASQDFHHLSTNHCVNLFSAAFSIFDDLLVLP